MLPTSPLVAIYHTIRQVRASATANAGIFQKNEAATRAALIDPILRALGWDTTNVRMVEPERTVENKQSLDYVLKDASGGIRSVIEAKKLGESLDKLGHVGALIGYAFSLKPQSFFITDGLNWHCYSPTHSHYQPVAILNLQDTHPIEAALQLVQWFDAALSGYGIEQEGNFSQPPIPTKNLSHGFTSRPSSKKPQKASLKLTISNTETVKFTDVSQLHLLNLPPGQKPKQLRLPNGTVKPIAIWKDILLEVCHLVLDTNPHLTLPLPDRAGKKRFLFSRAKPATGSSTQALYQGKPIFIGTHYSAADCIGNALYALQQLPSDQKSATLAVSF